MSKKRYRKKKSEQKKEEQQISGTERAGKAAGDFSRERKIWIIIGAVCLLIAVVSVIYAANAHNEMISFEDNLINCTMELEDTENQLDENNNKIRQLERDVEAMNLGAIGSAQLPEKYVSLYKERGLKNPAQNIISDLVQHQELIPYASTQGRSMRFYNRRQIYVISPGKVLANFGDQIISGWMLLQYSVKEGGKINWKILDSYCAHYDK